MKLPLIKHKLSATAILLTWVIVAALVAAGVLTRLGRPPQPVPAGPEVTHYPVESQVDLPVPYIAEAPDGNWTSPWINACEEASIAMVEKYYAGKVSVGIDEAKEFMQRLFDIQDRTYGSNVNSDAARTAEIINEHSSFQATIKDNPTVEEIKDQLRGNHPVISLHYGFDLNNPNIDFLPTGSSYHMIVIKGFDDDTGEFITNDDGDLKDGADQRYTYETIMNSLHDYVFATAKANGTPRVLFTAKKVNN